MICTVCGTQCPPYVHKGTDAEGKVHADVDYLYPAYFKTVKYPFTRAGTIVETYCSAECSLKAYEKKHAIPESNN